LIFSRISRIFGISLAFYIYFFQGDNGRFSALEKSGKIFEIPKIQQNSLISHGNP
jgi:hypothetical protein